MFNVKYSKMGPLPKFFGSVKYDELSEICFTG